MPTRSMTYEKAVEAAEHLKAIGDEEVYLERGPFPWHLATRCEPGGTHRIDMATSVWFYGEDVENGLCLRWSFDIEPYTSNGKGYYEIDAAGCREVMASLPEPMADQFRRYLLDCAAKVAKQGAEYQKHADRQAADAAALRAIAAHQSTPQP